MKKIKRIVTMALVACMSLMLMAIPSFADTPSSSDMGSVTINGLSEGVTASAYKIAEATYDESGNFLGYEMTISVTDGWSIGSDGSWDDPSEEQLAALFKAISNKTASGSAKAGSDGVAIIEDLEVGSYLIVITGSESVAYGMMIGSVSYAVDEETGEWKVDNGSFSVEGSTLWAKATTPTLTKTELNTSHVMSQDDHSASAEVGDEILYTITVDPIPAYYGEYPVFQISDVLVGLSMDEDEFGEISIKVTNVDGDTVELVKNEDYFITQTSDGFTVNFVINDDEYTLNDYAGGTLTIEYIATVTDEGNSTKYGSSESTNKATLTYATDSYIEGDTGDSSDEDYEYSLSMIFHKVDENGNSLSGATFGLYIDPSCDELHKINGEDVTAVSDEDGTITFSGLIAGVYYIKEIKAPAGYQLNSNIYKIDINDYRSGGNEEIMVCGQYGDPMYAYVTGTNDTGVEITNTKTGLLPNMGGRGTLIITLIGCAVVAGGVIGATASRRKKAA